MRYFKCFLPFSLLIFSSTAVAMFPAGRQETVQKVPPYLAGLSKSSEQVFRKNENQHISGFRNDMTNEITDIKGADSIMERRVSDVEDQFNLYRRNQNRSWYGTPLSAISDSLQWMSDSTKDVFGSSTSNIVVPAEETQEQIKVFEEKLKKELVAYKQKARNEHMFYNFFRSFSYEQISDRQTILTKRKWEQANIYQKTLSVPLRMISLITQGCGYIAAGEGVIDKKTAVWFEILVNSPANWALTVFNGEMEKKEKDAMKIGGAVIGLAAAATVLSGAAAGTFLGTTAAAVMGPLAVAINLVVLRFLKHMNVPMWFMPVPGGPLAPIGFALNNAIGWFGFKRIPVPDWLVKASWGIPVRPVLSLLITFIICKAIVKILERYEKDRKFEKMQKDIREGHYSQYELQLMYPHADIPASEQNPIIDFGWTLLRFGRKALTGI